MLVGKWFRVGHWVGRSVDAPPALGALRHGSTAPMVAQRVPVASCPAGRGQSLITAAKKGKASGGKQGPQGKRGPPLKEKKNLTPYQGDKR